MEISTRQISESDSREATKLLKIIGDFERISDHAANLLESTEEMYDKGVIFYDTVVSEITVSISPVSEILDLSLAAFLKDDFKSASMVKPLEQVIDQLKEQMRTRHILRLQLGNCSIDAVFVWSDLLTNLERTSNIAGCVIDIAHHNMNLHESL